MMFYCNGSSDQAFFERNVPFYDVGKGWGMPFTYQEPEPEPDVFSAEYYMNMWQPKPKPQPQLMAMPMPMPMWAMPYRRQTMQEAMVGAWQDYMVRCTQIMMGGY
jgi:hypothetical protein